MTGGLEDLTQDVLGDARVQASNVQRTLVRLRGGAATKGASAARGHHAALVAAASHRGSDRGRDRIGVLRNMQRRGRHVRRVLASILAILVARRAGVRLRWGRELTRGRGRTVISHLCEGCCVELREGRAGDRDEWEMYCTKSFPWQRKPH